MYCETGDEDQWRITALSSDAEGGFRPPIAFKKKEPSKADDTMDPPTDALTSGIERLVLEEGTHVVSKDSSLGSVEPLPSVSSAESSHVEPEHDLTAAKPLPPSFSDAPVDKESRKEGEVMASQEKDKELKKEDVPMPSEEEKAKDSKSEEVTFESLPDKPLEVMEADFSPDGMKTWLSSLCLTFRTLLSTRTSPWVQNPKVHLLLDHLLRCLPEVSLF